MIIKLVPSIWLIFSVLGIRDIMTLFSSSNMNDSASEAVLIVLARKLSLKNSPLVLTQVLHGHVLILHHFHKILLRETLLTILLHIDLHGELTIIIDFKLSHGVEVELKTFENHEEGVWHPLNAASLQSVYFLLTLLTVISIIALEHLTFNKGFKRFLNRMLIFHLKINCHKSLFSLRIVRTALANEFIS